MNDLNISNIEKYQKYISKYKKEGFLYIPRQDVLFETLYHELRDELEEKYNVGLGFVFSEDTLIPQNTGTSLNYTKTVNDKINLLIDYRNFASLCRKERIYTNHYKKRVTFIFDSIIKECGGKNIDNTILLNENKVILKAISSIADVLKYSEEYKLNFFRGHGSVNWKLLPTIYRDRLIEYESFFVREALLRYPEIFHDHKTTIEILATLQHYGCPTRLLDITSNPLVALYFACLNNRDEIGEFLAFNVGDKIVKYNDSDVISVVSNIAKLNEIFNIQKIRKYTIEKFNNELVIRKLLH